MARAPLQCVRARMCVCVCVCVFKFRRLSFLAIDWCDCMILNTGLAKHPECYFTPKIVCLF